MSDATLAKETPGTRDIWAVLESLLGQLGTTLNTVQSVAAAVDAAREAVGADVGFWFSRSANKVVGLCGRPYAEDRAATVARQLVAHLPLDKDYLRWVNPASVPGDETPDSALIVCDPRTQGSVVVLHFSPHRRFDEADAKVVRMTLKMLLAQRAQSQAGTKTMLNGLLQCLTTIIDAKDPYTSGHSERVARIAVLLVRQMGMSNIEGDVYLSGLLHDVGKIALRDEILQKPGKLTVEEFEEIRRHPLVGERIVGSIPAFDRLRPAVRHHHEHYNGRGYPDGLAGESIPLLARVLSVADACDAMMSPRRYRPARTPYDIDGVFNSEAGRQFDPLVIRAFMGIRHEIYPPIYQKGIGESAMHAIDSIVDNLNEQSMLRMAALKDKDLK